MAFSGSGRRATSLISTAVVAVLAGILWWIQAGSDNDTAPSPSNPATSASDRATSASDRATSASDRATSAETDGESGLPYVDLADLPPEAAETLTLIDEGGPFPHDQDGSTFHNFEGLLPGHEDGYYREYTVETPGSDDRGARRIVGGAEGELYWTEDHYESFEVIRR